MRSSSLARLFHRRPRVAGDDGDRWPPLPPDLRLEGADIWLRWPCLSDADAVFAYAGVEEVSAFMDWRPHDSAEESRRFLHLLEQNRNWGREAAFGIIERDSGELVGLCSLIAQRSLTVAEIGYALRLSAWGKGYMTDAVRLISDWAFRSLKLNEIFADVHPDNVASQRVLEKSGFRRQPTLVRRTIKGADSQHYRYLLQSERL